MNIGDWVACNDDVFKIQAIRGEFLMADEECGFLAERCSLLETEECPRCRQQVPEGQVCRRYSYSVYAGKFCDDCCLGYRDHCGPQGDPQDLDEDY